MIVKWVKRHLGNPQAMILFWVILGVLVLMPVFAGWVIAYHLEHSLSTAEHRFDVPPGQSYVPPQA